MSPERLRAQEAAGARLVVASVALAVRSRGWRRPAPGWRRAAPGTRPRQHVAPSSLPTSHHIPPALVVASPLSLGAPLHSVGSMCC